MDCQIGISQQNFAQVVESVSVWPTHLFEWRRLYCSVQMTAKTELLSAPKRRTRADVQQLVAQYRRRFISQQPEFRDYFRIADFCAKWPVESVSDRYFLWIYQALDAAKQQFFYIYRTFKRHLL
jgi:hypothetical protein